MFNEYAKPVRNNAIVTAEQRGYAHELLPEEHYLFPEEVLHYVKHMSIAEVIN